MATVSSINSGTTSSTQTKNTIMGKDDFLKMLIAQLKNQDPLNPLDGSNFAAQLAQFSSLEQLQNMNTQLQTLGTSFSSLNNVQVANLIGNEVSAKGNTTTVEGSTNTLYYNLPSDVKQGTVKIYNAQGTLMKTFSFGSQKAGINSLTWNSSNVSAGTYTFEVSATDSSGKDVSVTSMVTGKVTGATFKNNVPYLTVNGQDIAFADILSVRKPAN
ncbi:MAG: flagellar hook capping protein [Deltaproteobacteria bacterium]|nr:flagellar hook capping protein [Deltaproteobacteria bacterium]